MDGGKAFVVGTKVCPLGVLIPQHMFEWIPLTRNQLINMLIYTHNILRSPNQIYNMDETGMPLSPRTANIVAKHGQKKVRNRTLGKKEQITVQMQQIKPFHQW